MVTKITFLFKIDWYLKKFLEIKFIIFGCFDFILLSVEFQFLIDVDFLD